MSSPLPVKDPWPNKSVTVTRLDHFRTLRLHYVPVCSSPSSFHHGRTSTRSAYHQFKLSINSSTTNMIHGGIIAAAVIATILLLIALLLFVNLPWRKKRRSKAKSSSSDSSTASSSQNPSPESPPPPPPPIEVPLPILIGAGMA